MVAQIVPGPPFVFGALLVILAIMVAAFIPENMGRESSQGSRAFDHSDHSTGSTSKSGKAVVHLVQVCIKVGRPHI